MEQVDSLWHVAFHLVLDIRWLMGSGTDQGNIILLTSSGLHFVIFISWIICCEVFLTHSSQTSVFFQFWLGNLMHRPSEKCIHVPCILY